MGDDIVDLAVLAVSGLSTAPADAVEDVRTRVHWVSDAWRRGAARELIELILRAQGRWDVDRRDLHEPKAGTTAA